MDGRQQPKDAWSPADWMREARDVLDEHIADEAEHPSPPHEIPPYLRKATDLARRIVDTRTPF